MKFHRVATWLFDRLWEQVAAVREPDFIVGADNPDGAYLLRWFLIPRNRIFNIYLHQFLRDDDDRALHDHPWWSCSFILDGGYNEHTIAAGGIHHRELMEVGRLRILSARHAHRVELLRCPAPIRASTLFITGPRIRRWGFHCPEQGWIDFARFTRPGNAGETGAGCDA